MSQEKLNKNILCRISNRNSGTQFGFHFQMKMWRQEVQPGKCSRRAEKLFIYFLMWHTKLLTGTIHKHQSLSIWRTMPEELCSFSEAIYSAFKKMFRLVKLLSSKIYIWFHVYICIGYICIYTNTYIYMCISCIYV